jgi:pilus assembly protein Flp/PilA
VCVRSEHELVDVDQGLHAEPLSFETPGASTMAKFIAAAKNFVKDEEGATMVEYGLMLALIAIVCIAGATLIGTNANILFNKVGTTL